MSRLVAILWISTILCGCRTRATPAGPPASATRSDAPFTDVTTESGITFRHSPGGQPPLTILQTAGAGCAFLDADGDGWLDVFLVGSGRAKEGAPLHALYRNNHDGTFTDVTRRAALGGADYGMGCAVGDYDGDGDLDLYVTTYGANSLYRNNGDGTFTDVAARAGVATRGWSTSAGFADYDGDGWLDLYVGRYLEFNAATPQLCPREGIPLSCSPTLYEPQFGILYHNNGHGKFTDVTARAGVKSSGRTLGVVWSDYDGDGRPDLFLANDNAPNNLFHNEGHGRFQDVAVAAGVAYGPQGGAEASMGVDFGDYDGDGRPDLVFTNFQNEGAGLYHNEGKAGFLAAADRAGLLATTLPFLGFGTGFLDFDNDGRLDLFIANGHVQDAIQRVDAACAFAQPRQLFRNRGDGSFEEVTAASGPALTAPAVGRGVAFGDYDNDGDVDILVNNNGGSPMLLRNNARRDHHWLRVRLLGHAPNGFAIGARISVEAGGQRQVREIRAGSSYASAGDLRASFGLGALKTADRITVRWPGGSTRTFTHFTADRELVVPTGNTTNSP